MSTETYWTSVELPEAGTVSVLVRAFSGHQGGRVLKRSILDGTYADGTVLSRDDRKRALALLPALK